MTKDATTCFAYADGYCLALDIKQCKLRGCKFYKNKALHIAQRNAAIKMCREQGLCINCKYKAIPCKTSDEKEGKQ